MEIDRIQAFIKKHHVMTLATTGRDGGPWCAHVFYAWLPAKNMAAKETAAGNDGPEHNGPEHNGQAGCFVFTTDGNTRHGAGMESNARVAAGIALETRTVGRIQGLQIEGTVHNLASSASLSTVSPSQNASTAFGDGRRSIDEAQFNFQLSAEKVRRAYLKRFPYAVVADLSLWVLEPTLMKLTDNTLGFGKKLLWQKNSRL